jgi:hypothetical protein
MLRAAARAGAISGRWSRVTAAIAARNAIAGANGSSGHDEVELLEIEALWRTGQDPAPLLRRAISAMQSPGESIRYRLAMGVVALILADNLCDAAAADTAIETLKKVPFKPQDADLRDQVRVAHIIYHSSYGDLSVATATARELLSDPSADPGVSTRLGHIIRASVPLRRHGDWEEVVPLLCDGFEVAERHGLVSAACSIADILATTYFAMEDRRSAHAWYGRARALSQEQEGVAAIQSVALLGARLALADGDVAAAKHLLPASFDDAVRDPNLRRRNEALALQLEIALLEFDPVRANRVAAALMPSYLTARPHGGQDYPTAVLVRYLQQARSASAAAKLLREYLGVYRRDECSVPSYLLAPLGSYAPADDSADMLG